MQLAQVKCDGKIVIYDMIFGRGNVRFWSFHLSRNCKWYYEKKVKIICHYRTLVGYFSNINTFKRINHSFIMHFVFDWVYFLGGKWQCFIFVKSHKPTFEHFIIYLNMLAFAFKKKIRASCNRSQFHLNLYACYYLTHWSKSTSSIALWMPPSASI